MPRRGVRGRRFKASGNPPLSAIAIAIAIVIAIETAHTNQRFNKNLLDATMLLAAALSVFSAVLQGAAAIAVPGGGIAGNPTQLIKPYLRERAPLQDIVRRHLHLSLWN